MQFKNKNMDEIISAVNEVLQSYRSLRLKGKDYIIRPFTDYDEIKREGNELRHAVAYYAEGRLAQGKDYLFAMRKACDPNSPYITLEFGVKGELLLAKKIHNTPVDIKEENEFIDIFRRQVMLPHVYGLSKTPSVLLFDRIVSTTEYRRLAKLPAGEDASVEALKRQLNDTLDYEKDLWWCPVTDISLLTVKSGGEPLRVVIVSDKTEAIACELPFDYTEGEYMAIGEVGRHDRH